MEFEKRIVLVAEVVGVSTGVAFVLSGLGNGIVFAALWRLNYFAIASPSDIIMSGFLLGLMLALFLAVAGVVFLTIRMLKRWLADPAQPAPPVKRLGLTEIGWLILSAWIGIDLAQDALFTTVQSIEPAPTNAPLVGETEAADADPWRFGYATGLRLAPNDSTGDDCWAAPVIWMGTDRVLLACSSGNRLMVNSESLLLQAIDIPVPSRDTFMQGEFAIMDMPSIAETPQPE